MTTTTDSRFYVYAFLRLDGTPFYVGKGQGRRINDPRGRRFRLPPKDRRKVLASGLTEPEAFEYEIALISLLGRKDQGTGCLRNFTDGGEGVSGLVFTAEHRAKLSAAHCNPSPELRAKLSAALKGRTPGPEHRANLSAALKGRKRSPEHQANLNAALTGRTSSSEHRANLSAALKGSTHSPEHRAKIGAATAARHAAKRALREALSGQLSLLALEVEP